MNLLPYRERAGGGSFPAKYENSYSLAAIGVDMVLFGSDHADNQATEREKIRTCGISDEEIDWVRGKFAAPRGRGGN